MRVGLHVSILGSIDMAVERAVERQCNTFQIFTRNPRTWRFGEALIRSGASPGQPEFAEAEAVLRKSVAKQPNDASSRLCLGELYLVEGHLDDAIAQLQRAQQIDPSTPAVYASLAKAYQRRGDLRRAQEALEVLTQLNQAQADRISSAPGDRKVSYGGRVADDEPSH